jgi:hemoglobin/transferrin/lactoferrin receptor protein
MTAKAMSPLEKVTFLLFLTLAVFSSRETLAQSESNATEELSPMVVTAKGGFAEPWASSPWSTDRLRVSGLRHRARTMPEALAGLPSIMVQKTALGQSSPYLRGLTGYHNVLLVDGIRLNHSAMRSGPNQYWSTVEILGSERIEVVRGPNGIIYGADAIGGVVNVLSAEPSFSNAGMVQGGNFFGRLSSAERSWSAGVNGTVSNPDWFAELSHAERSFGDLEGGKDVGKQVNTGYDSRGTTFRLSRKLNEDARMTLGLQQTFMDDVPRTHKTVNGLTWEGLSPGSEIWRRLDQKRNLYFGKFSWEDAGGWSDKGIITLSMHQHGQERTRMKKTTKGGDFQHFDLDDFGFSARFETDDPWGGRIAYGGEWHRESLTSGGYKFDDLQVRGTDLAQGALAADAQYDRYALYLNDRYETESGWTFEPGIRFSSVRAGLERYYLKNGDASTIQAPETKTYDEWIGSIRASKEIAEGEFLFAGLSQGFRPPSLYDLTSTDETSAIERPNTTLDPENFLQAEIGFRENSDSLYWGVSTYRTWVNDMIIRSPIESGKSAVLKANGDGFIQGFEIEFGYDWTPSWRSEIRLSWMDGEVEQMLDNNATGTVAVDGRNYTPVNRAPDRLMPSQAMLVTRFAPEDLPWWGELSVLAIGKANELSLKDRTDSSRIPENGTPGFAIFGLRGGRSIGEHTTLTLAGENLGDVDYRIHGSGLNGPGRNFIFSFAHSF